MGTPALNGHAVDLTQVKAAAEQRQALADQRDELERQLLTQAGLVCGCGERIRRSAVVYFAVVEGPVAGPQGPTLGLNLVGQTCCSRTCSQALALEASATARRDADGAVTWLDEARRADARRDG